MRRVRLHQQHHCVIWPMREQTCTMAMCRHAFSGQRACRLMLCAPAPSSWTCILQSSQVHPAMDDLSLKGAAAGACSSDVDEDARHAGCLGVLAGSARGAAGPAGHREGQGSRAQQVCQLAAPASAAECGQRREADTCGLAWQAHFLYSARMLQPQADISLTFDSSPGLPAQ